MAADVENWDDDGDFAGDFTFGRSLGGQSATFSSRRSASGRSESVAADEDWQVLLTSNDENARDSAIASAKQVGIPIPMNVPPSALLGGAIKRLGKTKTAPKKDVADEWGDDFDFDDGSRDLQLKLPAVPSTPANSSNNNNVINNINNYNNHNNVSSVATASGSRDASVDDDFDSEWAEGSLGIRFGGTRRDARGRSSSISAMSPSMGSCTSITLESEDDDLGGLVVPDEPIDFKSRLEKRKLQEAEIDTKPDPPATLPSPKRIRPGENDDEDMLSGLELDGIDFAEHSKKRTLNRNVKIQASVKAAAPRTSITTITFTDKAANSRIPRPAGAPSKSSNLAPVYEAGNGQATQGSQPPSGTIQRLNRPSATTTSAQLLRSKRSAPVLRPPVGVSQRHSIPFLPAGASNAQSQHVATKNPVRNPSENRPMSPPARSFSRMSVTEQQLRATPGRPSTGARRIGYAAPALARVAASNQQINVTKRKVYGHGNELDAFDDLPTSVAKESKYIKEPKAHGAPRTLRRMQSKSDLQMHVPERSSTATPPSGLPSTPGAPPTPKSFFGAGTRQTNTPRFAQDTAASRNAREQRLNTISTQSQPTLRRGDGPVMPSVINWKAQVAARSPHNSPSVARKKSKDVVRRNFISPADAHKQKGMGDQRGMVYNAAKQRWEGNENAVYNFPDNPSTSTLPVQATHAANHSQHHHTSSIPNIALGVRELNTLPRQVSPPRPALISNVSAQRGPRIERGMVFDPQQMKWLKVDTRQFSYDPGVTSPGSVSIEEEEDPFAGIDDLPDDRTKVVPGAGGKENDSAHGQDDWNLGEEFDLGQRFIKRQRVEEAEWRKWTERWFEPGQAGVRPRNEEDEAWKWDIRRVAEKYVAQGGGY